MTIGDYSDGTTGWTLYVFYVSLIAGKAVFYRSGAGDAYFLQLNRTVVGQTYYVSFDIIDYVEGEMWFNDNSSWKYNANGSYSRIYQADRTSLLFDNYLSGTTDFSIAL